MEKTKLKTKRDYYWVTPLSIPSDVLDINKLLIFSRKLMTKQKRVQISKEAYKERYGESEIGIKYWDLKLPEVDNQTVNDLAVWIEENYGLPINYDGSYVSILVLNEGDTLPAHMDPYEVQSGSIIVQLIGGFRLKLGPASVGDHGKYYDEYLQTEHDSKDKILDEIEYHPSDAIVLNNAQYIHSGETTDDYKLSLLFSIDPKFDLNRWSHERSGKI